MAIKISFVNFKGGVAKTITAVNFAAVLANRRYKTLLVDMDPQSNASLWLLGGEREGTRFMERLNEPRKTVYQLFLDQIEETNHFSFSDAVIKDVVTEERGLDLLPNTYQAIDLEGKLVTGGGLGSINHVILKRQLKDVEQDYDFVVFDCAPNLYLTTINALLFSNYYIIPVNPDYFSRSGLIILGRQIRRIWDKCGVLSDDDLELLEVLITRIKEGATLDVSRRVDLERGLEELKREGIVSPNAVLFQTFFNDTVSVPRSIEKGIPTIHDDMSYGPLAKYVERLNEFTDEALKQIRVRFPKIAPRLGLNE
jgi:chromosome partitioning protein